MDEKLEKYFDNVSHLCWGLWNDFNSGSDIKLKTTIKEIYLDGCHAQAEKDREAVRDYMQKCNDDENMRLPSGKDLLDELSAAEIKE